TTRGSASFQKHVEFLIYPQLHTPEKLKNQVLPNGETDGRIIIIYMFGIVSTVLRIFRMNLINVIMRWQTGKTIPQYTHSNYKSGQGSCNANIKILFPCLNPILNSNKSAHGTNAEKQRDVIWQCDLNFIE